MKIHQLAMTEGGQLGLSQQTLTEGESEPTRMVESGGEALVFGDPAAGDGVRTSSPANEDFSENKSETLFR
jgi:hypothetical protein